MKIKDLSFKKALGMFRDNCNVTQAINETMEDIRTENVKEFLPDIANLAIGSKLIIPLNDKTICIKILPP